MDQQVHRFTSQKIMLQIIAQKVVAIDSNTTSGGSATQIAGESKSLGVGIPRK
jgi:hypothetical protein